MYKLKLFSSVIINSVWKYVLLYCCGLNNNTTPLSYTITGKRQFKAFIIIIIAQGWRGSLTNCHPSDRLSDLKYDIYSRSQPSSIAV